MARAPLKLHEKAVVSKEAILEGEYEITVGEGTVIHPKCRIWTRDGPVRVGSNNLLQEGVSIVNYNGQGNGEAAEPVLIGDFNVVEVGSHFEGLSMGNGNVIECCARVGTGCVIPNGCVIGAKIHIRKDIELSDNMVVFGSRLQRHVREHGQDVNVRSLQTKLELLHKLLPTTQKLLKPQRKAAQ